MNTAEASYKELREHIKQAKLNNPSSKDFWGDYTHHTTEELRELVQDYMDNLDAVEEIPTISVESRNNDLASVIGLLKEAIQVIESKIGQKDNSELEELHKKAMEIEFELENSVN